MYDGVSIYYPELTELPIPLIAFEHLESARTYAVGLKLIVSHTIKLTTTLDLRLHGNFQFDSNEDSIRGYGIGIAKTWWNFNLFALKNQIIALQSWETLRSDLI